MTEETRKKCSTSRIKWWESLTDEQQKDYRKRIGYHHKINVLESNILELIPKDLKIRYTGDHSFWIRMDGWKFKYKNPDFVVGSFRETKKVIEVFGNYWHTPEEATKLIRAYARGGIECLLVWESDFRSDPEGTVERIFSFIKG